MHPHGIDVVAEASDGTEAVEAVKRTRPDVVLMDIRMPGLDGLEATRRLLTGTPGEPRVIILTTFDLDQLVYDALAAGASGFLLKDVTLKHLVAAVRLIRTGDALLAPSITRRLVERFVGVGRGHAARNTHGKDPHPAPTAWNAEPVEPPPTSPHSHHANSKSCACWPRA